MIEDVPSADQAPGSILGSNLAVARWFAVAAVLTLGARFLCAESSAEWDEEVYFAIGKGWANGLIPYRDIFDHKPPLLYAAYSVLSWGGRSMLSVRVSVAFFSAFAGIVFGRALGESLKLERNRAILATVMFIIGMSFRGGLTANTEVFFAPALVLACASGLRQSTWGAILWGAVALSFKYTAGLDLFGVFLVIAALDSRPRPLVRAAVQLGGAVLVALVQYGAWQIYFQGHGVDLFWNVFGANLAHAEDRVPLLSPQAIRGFKSLSVFGLLALFWFAAKGKVYSRPVAAAGLIWAGCSVVHALLTGQYHPHYFMPIACPLVLLVANLRLPPNVVRYAALGSVVVSLYLVRSANRSRVHHEYRVQMIEPACGLVRDGYYVLDETSAYRICKVARTDRFLFPPLYLNPHFVRFSGSGGVDGLRDRVLSGQLAGVIFNPQITPQLPPELASLPEEKIARFESRVPRP